MPGHRSTFPRQLATIFTYLTGASSQLQKPVTSTLRADQMQRGHQGVVTLMKGGYEQEPQTYYVGPAAKIEPVRLDVEDSHRFHNAKPTVLLSLDRGSAQEFSKAIIEAINGFFRDDDVFCESFLTDTVVIRDISNHVTQARDWTDVLRPTLTGELVPWEIRQIIEFRNGKGLSGETHIPDGPYFLTQDSSATYLAEAWRLYPDSLDAFATTFVPVANESYRFEPFVGTPGDNIWRPVAVPSRLYSPKSALKPLAGKRFSIKDNFKVTGIKTTQTNRAFVETYGPESETAEFVKTLIDLGAVIVGKTKMCAFASSEEATDQWVDFHAPFNPRADGYQSPSGSTTGGAAALAGYHWLDFSVGTDTTGSVRWPAAWNGLFGMRISWESKAIAGVYPSCRLMDTLGLLSRDLTQLQNLVRHSLPLLATPQTPKENYPKRLLYCTDFFPHPVSAQQDLIEAFVTELELVLDVERTNMSIAERWKQCPPVEAGDKDIQTYLNKTAYYPFYYDGYNEFAQFRADYEKKSGKPVYVGPYMRWKWDQGVEVTLEQKEQALEELEVYKRWFDDNIMKPQSGHGSDAILVLPCGSGEPKYRDLPNKAPSVVPAFSPNYIASMLGLPQLVLPVGQIPFESRISRRTEYLPIVASIVGASGSDMMLLDVGNSVLTKAKKPTIVQTGRFMFKQ